LIGELLGATLGDVDAAACENEHALKSQVFNVGRSAVELFGNGAVHRGDRDDSN
jgi:hypothetical protein